MSLLVSNIPDMSSARKAGAKKLLAKHVTCLEENNFNRAIRDICQIIKGKLVKK